ncbi:hypothetical protein ACWDOR_23835 [Streptosporangium canum]
MIDEERAPGEVLRRNIKHIRESQRITFVELADRLASIGRPIPVLGLRRIERGERRIDVDDLLAIAYALGAAPVDLLIPGNEKDTTPYSITPGLPSTVGTARRWIRGEAGSSPGEPNTLFGIPAPPWSTQPNEAMAWMPSDRAGQALEHLVARQRKEGAGGGSDQED